MCHEEQMPCLKGRPLLVVLCGNLDICPLSALGPFLSFKTTGTWIEAKALEAVSCLGLVIVDMKSISLLPPPPNSPKSKANKHK